MKEYKAITGDTLEGSICFNRYPEDWYAHKYSTVEFSITNKRDDFCGGDLLIGRIDTDLLEKDSDLVGEGFKCTTTGLYEMDDLIKIFQFFADYLRQEIKNGAKKNAPFA